MQPNQGAAANGISAVRSSVAGIHERTLRSTAAAEAVAGLDRQGAYAVINYDDPAQEGRWCDERRAEVAAYLRDEGVAHGRIGEWPAWHVAPYVSIWAIESAARPEWVGWWVICGDLPTDYVSADAIKHPRDAMRAIGKRWLEVAGYMSRGDKHPTVNIGSRDTWPTLGPILGSKAETLAKWVNDESVWEDEAP